MNEVRWDKIPSEEGELSRAKVPGGWLVCLYAGGLINQLSMTFYPDADHVWGQPQVNPTRKSLEVHDDFER